MKLFLWSFYMGTTLLASPGLMSSPVSAQPVTQPATPPVSAFSTLAATCPEMPNAQDYDVIVFGDEVPGIMTALKIRRELQWHQQQHRVALITEGNTADGLGGHLVRGGLAYLDRNQVPPNLQPQYGTFGHPSHLYQEFLHLGRVRTIALDRFTISQNLEQILDRSGVEVIDGVELEAVQTTESLVCALTASGQTYSARQFVDASQSGELAATSGVTMMRGLEALGLPNSVLSLGLMIDLHGVTIDQLKIMEAELIDRYFNPRDHAAQQWLTTASGDDPAKREDLLQSLVDYYDNPKLLYQGTPDSADMRSLAFSILVHGQLGTEYDLKLSGFLFDRANIAIFSDRLSLNALLFDANAETAQQLSRSGAKPTAKMLAIATEVKTLFEQMGVPRVEIMNELYVRNAGQIAHPIDELSATLMVAGGLTADDALGTFGYRLDDRGGIEGLEEQVDESSLGLFNFEQMPVFNYGFRHTLPKERENLAVLGPASGFGGLGITAGRIVEFNVSVGEGLAIAIVQAITQQRSLQTITNTEVRQAMGYTPTVYGYRTDSFRAISTLEKRLRSIDYEQMYVDQARTFLEQRNYAEVTRAVSRALTINPRSAHAYYLRGKIQAEAGNHAQARADLEQAIALYQGQGDSSSASHARGTLESLLN